ncbi:MAG: restriction endonuclease [Burkholderiales bacterium]|jgi:restriction system protein|nr:restriction endonuclease [Burkholderiales bacterium]
MPIPTYDKLFNPLLAAIRQLGGSASIREQERVVAEILNLSDREVNEIHRGNRSKLSYRLAWARNYLKRFGLLDNSKRGVWSLTAEGLKTTEVDKTQVKRFVVDLDRNGKDEEIEKEVEKEESWEDELLSILKAMSPQAFERLCQRLLRESGFIQVEVTGRSGDGGIDGKGVVRVGGLLSFHVLFQAKRYKGSVSPTIVRDFRGALVGRADKGLIITTGTFTRDARLEAQRDGATPIDLIDGEDLAQKLKELGIGVEVKVKNLEEVLIDKDYFKQI